MLAHWSVEILDVVIQKVVSLLGSCFIVECAGLELILVDVLDSLIKLAERWTACIELKLVCLVDLFQLELRYEGFTSALLESLLFKPHVASLCLGRVFLLR